MNPKFDNKGLNTLYNVLMWCSAGAAGLALAFYRSGKISLAAVVALCTLCAFFILFELGWRFLSKKENPTILDEVAAEETAESGFDLYKAKTARTPQRVFLSLLTVVILLIAWGWAWAQHTFDGVFFMDAPVSTYLGATSLCLGLLIYAHFPFLMDEDHFKNMSQVNLAINSKLVTALFLALGLLSYAVLKDRPGTTPWQTISMLVLGFVWLDYLIYYLERIRHLGNPQAATEQASDAVNILGLKVRRDIALTVIRAVILIVLVAAWVIKLTVGGQGFNGIFQPTMTMLVFTLVSLCFLVISYLPNWFFSRADGRQLASFVINQLFIATVFALFALTSSLQESLHWESSNRFITICSIILFLAVGCFFGGVDKRREKKNK